MEAMIERVGRWIENIQILNNIENIKVPMVMAQNMVMVNSIGLTEDATIGIGLIENNMEKEYIEAAMELSEKENGMMAKNWNGLTNDLLLFLLFVY